MTLPLSRRGLNFRIGVGSKFPDPNPIPTSASGFRDVTFHPNGRAVAAASFSTPFAVAYPWSDLGFGARFPDPTVLPTGSARAVAFSPSGRAVVFVHITTPFVTAYRWTPTGFGTKYTNPSSLPPGNGNKVLFNSAGTVVFLTTDASSNGLVAYQWSDSTGFGTRFSNPSVAVANAARAVVLSPSENVVVVSTASSPRVAAYVWSNTTGFGTKFADPVVSIPGEGRLNAAFNPTGTAVAITHDSSASPGLTVYRWSSAGFGAKFSDPPGAGFNASPGIGSVQFSKSGDVIIWINTSLNPPAYAYYWSEAGFGRQINTSRIPFTTRVGELSPRGDVLMTAMNQSPYISAYTWN